MKSTLLTTVGGNYFAIDVIDAGTTPFRIASGAGNNALIIDDQGDVGIGTSTPVVELQVTDGDTPTLRLEQNGSNGWTPQIWDVAGNETNFFIRDVTNGSKLPFKIKPGAPDNSIFIAADGDIGLGTTNPTGDFHINGTGSMRLQNGGYYWDFVTSGSTVTNTVLTITPNGISSQAITFDAAGNLILPGALLEASDENKKENFDQVNVDDVLDRVLKLDISTWNYIRDGDEVTHIGPTAQDFYETFAYGHNDQTIASLDVNGVALASIQALNGELEAAQDQIADLQAENEDLEARLEELEALVYTLLESETGE